MSTFTLKSVVGGGSARTERPAGGVSLGSLVGGVIASAPRGPAPSFPPQEGDAASTAGIVTSPRGGHVLTTRSGSVGAYAFDGPTTDDVRREFGELEGAPATRGRAPSSLSFAAAGPSDRAGGLNVVTTPGFGAAPSRQEVGGSSSFGQRQPSPRAIVRQSSAPAAAVWQPSSHRSRSPPHQGRSSSVPPRPTFVDDPPQEEEISGEGEGEGWDNEHFGEAYDSEEMEDDDAPVVPPELLEHLEGVHESSPSWWDTHPGHPTVLALLYARGVTPEHHSELVHYHMAHVFLDCLLLVAQGAYFVKYGLPGTAPKERFVRLRMLADAEGAPVPSLVITIHEGAVQVIDHIRLEDLVGVTRGVTDSPAFHRHRVHADVIKGSFVGQHRSRLSTKGAFTLWFYDRRTRQPKSLDLLTVNLSAFEVWTRTMEGVLSVNSVCLHRASVTHDLQRLFKYVRHYYAEAYPSVGS